MKIGDHGAPDATNIPWIYRAGNRAGKQAPNAGGGGEERYGGPRSSPMKMKTLFPWRAGEGLRHPAPRRDDLASAGDRFPLKNRGLERVLATVTQGRHYRGAGGSHFFREKQVFPGCDHKFTAKFIPKFIPKFGAFLGLILC